MANSTAQHKHPHPGLTHDEWTLYLAIVVALVLLAGLMSGLTLGLMSMNVLDMEVSQRWMQAHLCIHISLIIDRKAMRAACKVTSVTQHCGG